MKKMKRLVAALLAGMMVLAMLTACGGSTATTIGKQFENKYIDAINSVRTLENGKLTNDANLRNQAMELLNTVDQNGKILRKNAIKTIGPSMENGKASMTVISVIYETPESITQDEYTAMAITPENMQKELTIDKNDQTTIDAMNSITKIGIATIERNGKTYAAIAIYMEQTIDT